MLPSDQLTPSLVVIYFFQIYRRPQTLVKNPREIIWRKRYKSPTIARKSSEIIYLINNGNKYNIRVGEWVVSHNLLSSIIIWKHLSFSLESEWSRSGDVFDLNSVHNTPPTCSYVSETNFYMAPAYNCPIVLSYSSVLPWVFPDRNIPNIITLLYRHLSNGWCWNRSIPSQSTTAITLKLRAMSQAGDYSASSESVPRPVCWRVYMDWMGVDTLSWLLWTVIWTHITLISVVSSS